MTAAEGVERVAARRRPRDSVRTRARSRKKVVAAQAAPIDMPQQIATTACKCVNIFTVDAAADRPQSAAFNRHGARLNNLGVLTP
jgi:hypothetical protein